MARKKAHKKHVVRRRKVGAITTDIMQPLTILGGVVAGRLLSKVIPSSVSAKTQPVIVAAAGLAGFMLLKNSTAKLLSAGVFASGGLQLVQSMGIINGLQPHQSAPFVVGGNNQRRMYNRTNQRRIAGNGQQPQRQQQSLVPMVVGGAC